MRLLLIRHGQTPSNIARLLDTGEPGPGLTELGEEQAAALPEALSGERIEVLYASTLIRTQLTAAPLAADRGLDVRVRDGIRELKAGDLEMRGDSSAHERYMGTAFGWSDGLTDVRMPGGENGVEALARYDAVVAEAAETGVRTAALVSHGAVIRMWAAARARNIDTAFAAARQLGNTGVVILNGSPEHGWTAEVWEGSAIGGPEVDTPAAGPAAEPVQNL